jgi:hypothetical protein
MNTPSLDETQSINFIYKEQRAAGCPVEAQAQSPPNNEQRAPGVPASSLAYWQRAREANDQIYGGWPMVLSGLATLETGEVFATPGSRRFLQPAALQ